MRRDESLLQGEYKNIPFKLRKESITQLGQKRVIHDYFNSSARYAEPQGRMPLEFSVDVFFSGPQWQQDFQEFRAALEDASPGTLILPTFGVFSSIVAMPASAEASQTEVGEIKLPVTFTETIERPSPVDTTQTSEDVASQAAVVRSDLSESFENAWQPPSSGNNIDAASSDFKSLSEDVRKIAGAVRAAQDFQRRVDNALRSSARIARLLFSDATPEGFLQNIAVSITGGESFRTFAELATLGSTQPNAMNDIAAGIRPAPSTGVVQPQPSSPEPDVTVPTWDDDTAERRERNRNRYAAVNAFRLIGLIGMHEAASVRRYSTTDDIDRVKALLDLYYSLLIEGDETGVIVPVIRGSIDRLRGITLDVLRRRRQNAYAVVEIYLHRYTPVTLLAYELYGERISGEAQLQYLAGLLRGLNTDQPAHKLRGTVRVLEIR